MTISDGISKKNLTSYPPSRLISDAKIPLWMDLEEEEDIQPLLTIGIALTFKTKTEDDTICNFISEPTSLTRQAYHILNNTLKEQEQEQYELIEEALFSNTEITQ